MNFVRSNADQGPRLICEGDLVILYERHDALSHAWMQKDGRIQNRYGSFNHNDIIGKPFGFKAKAFDAEGCWLFVLEPTPELWSSAFKTRTQIVNEMDQSLVTFMLDVKPGDTVVESGTGSACMTLSLARAVGHPDPSQAGRVFTFEYNSYRAEEAKKEMKAMGVDHLVTIRCHDVCAVTKQPQPQPQQPSSSSLSPAPSLEAPAEGAAGEEDKAQQQDSGAEAPYPSGGFPGVAAGSADALFLDVPSPYLALDYALAVLKPYANICCYSPCISQVTDTCAKMRELGFTNIRMLEFRQRPSDGREIELENIDLGQGQGQTRVEQEQEQEQEQGPALKKSRGEAAEATATATAAAGADGAATTGHATPFVSKRAKGSAFPNQKLAPTAWNVSRAHASMKSHTAFLTFARSPLAPFDVERDKSERAEARARGRQAGDHLRGCMMPQGKY